MKKVSAFTEFIQSSLYGMVSGTTPNYFTKANISTIGMLKGFSLIFGGRRLKTEKQPLKRVKTKTPLLKSGFIKTATE